MSFELTVLTTHAPIKAGKIFWLDVNNELKRDTVAHYSEATAVKKRIDSQNHLKELIESLTPNESLLAGVNAQESLNVSPTGDFGRDNETFQFAKAPALMVIDSDDLSEAEGNVAICDALADACPAIADTVVVQAPSTSSNILTSDGVVLRGLKGVHTYIVVKNGRDIPRALEALHKRLWLKGYSRPKISDTGRLLERSYVDLALVSPSQPVYQHAHCGAGLKQDKPIKIHDGESAVLDTEMEIAPLSAEELQKYNALVAEAAEAMADQMKAERDAYIERSRQALIDRGTSSDEADRLAKALASGIATTDLWGDALITLSDGTVVTVKQILDDKAKDHDQSCRDPAEPTYGGSQVAKIFLNEGGKNLIKSFAHGGRQYYLHESDPSARDAFKPSRDVLADDWTTPVNPFVELPVPSFPIDSLPSAMRACCEEHSAGSGFDIGGYAFSLFVAAANLIDHRAKLKVGPIESPPNLWGCLYGESASGKSPTLRASTKFIQSIHERLMKASQRSLNNWLKLDDEDKKTTPKPPFTQRIVSDTTVEALATACVDNPNGITLIADELTEFVGRMDAYSGGGSSSKDRGKYLSAYDGGVQTINRVGKPMPQVVDNFSMGLIAGVQNEKFAQMLNNKNGSDGLFQRMMFWVLSPAGQVDYNALINPFVAANCLNIFERLNEWTEDGSLKKQRFTVEAEILPMMQEYHQAVRTVAQRTTHQRLAEHLDKYPGFLARILLALHCVECASQGALNHVIGVQTFRRAIAIVRCLWRHSEAVLESQGKRSGMSTDLMLSACEAILTKKWTKFGRGDLSRDATHWRSADPLHAERAIDIMIELGWIRDVTEVNRNRRGRSSAGKFVVNPIVPTMFLEEETRIAKKRQDRFIAIKKTALSRPTAGGE